MEVQQEADRDLRRPQVTNKLSAPEGHTLRRFELHDHSLIDHEIGAPRLVDPKAVKLGCEPDLLSNGRTLLSQRMCEESSVDILPETGADGIVEAYGRFKNTLPRRRGIDRQGKLDPAHAVAMVRTDKRSVPHGSPGVRGPGCGVVAEAHTY